MKRLLVLTGLMIPGMSLACPGSEAAAAKASADTKTVAVAEAKADASACAKKAELVGGNCSYTTGMMAQRVLSEGEAWSFTGNMAKAENALPSHVAAPFTVGPDAAVNVVANEIVEDIVENGKSDTRLTIEGKRLEVDGVTYFVVTGYAAAQS